MRKKIIIASIFLVAVFSLVLWFSEKQTTAEQTTIKEATNVTTQNVQNSLSLAQKIQYPAVSAGDQEITLTAQTSGTITQINFDLGSRVSQNISLATIDSIGNFSGEGEKGLKNSNVQALELEVESTEAAYKSAKNTYEHDKTYTNKKAKEIAKISLETAKINLRGALDSRFVVAPISGVITKRFVSQGDSVSVGASIATISKTGLTKVQFFVDKEDLAYFKSGLEITIKEDDREITGIVTRISPVADLTTRRFLIEAKPTGGSLLIGSVMEISFEIIKKPKTDGNLILPLSAITIGQNESYIFIVENGKAKKINVSIADVQGESAEITASLPSDAEIIINGSKLVLDGEEIKIVN